MLALTFSLAGLRGAIPVPNVREVARAVAITPLAGTPPLVEGIVDVHGTTVPVLDMRARLGLPPKALSVDEHLVMATADGRTIAFRVDEALDVVDVTDAEVAKGLATTAPLVAGMARLHDGVLAIYDFGAFLSQAESDALAAALDPGTAPRPDRP